MKEIQMDNFENWKLKKAEVWTKPHVGHIVECLPKDGLKNKVGGKVPWSPK